MLRKGDLSYADICKLHLDINELCNYSIVDIYKMDENLCSNDDDLHTDYESCGDNVEHCKTCFFSDGDYCMLKNINTDSQLEVCWFYRDCLTMRATDDFKDDYDRCDMY